MIGLNAGGAFLAEVMLTLLFVFVVLSVTRTAAWPQLFGVSQLWLFIVAPLVGGILAALLSRYFYPGEHNPAPEDTAAANAVPQPTES
jgi:aquaporin Z